MAVYFKVPVINGEMDIPYEYMVQGIQVSNTEAYVALRPGFTERGSWTEVTEAEWIAIQPVIPTPAQPSIEQQLAEVKQNQLILMDAIATVFETISGGAS